MIIVIPNEIVSTKSVVFDSKIPKSNLLIATISDAVANLLYEIELMITNSLKYNNLFVTNKIFEFEIREFIENIDNQLITNECSFFPQKFYVKFFHPPMWKF